MIIHTPVLSLGQHRHAQPDTYYFDKGYYNQHVLCASTIWWLFFHKPLSIIMEAKTEDEVGYKKNAVKLLFIKRYSRFYNRVCWKWQYTGWRCFFFGNSIRPLYYTISSILDENFSDYVEVSLWISLKKSCRCN